MMTRRAEQCTKHRDTLTITYMPLMACHIATISSHPHKVFFIIVKHNPATEEFVHGQLILIEIVQINFNIVEIVNTIQQSHVNRLEYMRRTAVDSIRNSINTRWIHPSSGRFRVQFRIDAPRSIRIDEHGLRIVLQVHTSILNNKQCLVHASVRVCASLSSSCRQCTWRFLQRSLSASQKACWIFIRIWHSEECIEESKSFLCNMQIPEWTFQYG